MEFHQSWSMHNTLEEYFRCPKTLLSSVEGTRGTGMPGYFRVGDDLICFGRPSAPSARHLRQPVQDLESRILLDDARVRLPFELAEVVDNLRAERYVDGAPSLGKRLGNELLHQAYYAVRPLLPLSVRKHMQKVHLRGWDDIPFPHWPVDSTVDRLMAKVLKLSLRAKGDQSIPFIWFWPDGTDACSIMTHDVEAEEGRQFCSQLMDINDGYGIPASFQIVPERRYQVSADFLESIRSRGFEVNVQDLDHDGRLFRNYDEFLRRAEKINRYGREYGASGFRSAILYRNQDWLSALEFEYDMSVPNVAHLDPQRGGCCTVMPYFIGDILELPVTTTQDHSLFNILNDYSMTLWRQQAEIILQHHGLISFIVHPDYIIGERAQNSYRSLLELMSQLRAERNVWLARPSEVNRWWRQRSEMTLEWKRGRWEVEGDGKERARVAYASLDGDQLKYCKAELTAASK